MSTNLAKAKKVCKKHWDVFTKFNIHRCLDLAFCERNILHKVEDEKECVECMQGTDFKTNFAN